jgi:hypothetical protein
MHRTYRSGGRDARSLDIRRSARQHHDITRAQESASERSAELEAPTTTRWSDERVTTVTYVVTLDAHRDQMID